MKLNPTHRLLAITPLALLFSLSLSCGGGDPEPETTTETSAEGSNGAQVEDAVGAASGAVDDHSIAPNSEYDLVIPMVQYSWNPQAGDEGVSEADGGPGFAGEGWESNMRFPALGSADAVKGGRMVLEIPSWPATLRLQGKDYNTSFNYRARDMCQNGLLHLHDSTLEYIPALATHWKISEDKSKYTFRINPDARWSDGKEVTSVDVVATYRLYMDDGLLFPSNKVVYGRFEEPVAESKYIVSVQVREESWRNFMYFAASMMIMPAHQISIPGEEYLSEFQNKYHAVTGPYTLDEENLEMNRAVSLIRRDDWWDKDNPAWVGMWNIDEFKFLVISERLMAFEKSKKGELDYYVIPKAAWWADELLPEKVDAVKRGLMQKRKFYNAAPVGTSGLALNMTRKPLDDLNVRKALAHLRNRPLMMDQLFYGEYSPLDSYWQYGDYRNSKNGMTEYSPFDAVDLLEKSGWTETDDEGYRLKGGNLLELDLDYRSELSEPSLTIFQEDCRKAGIKINLKRVDNAAFWKKLRQREYDISNMAWGALIFPNPETSWNGALATQVDNNNVTAFSDPRVDELLVEYDRCYDVDRRAEIIRKIDSIVFAAHPYVLDWYNPAQRVCYTNKYSMPNFGVWRTKDRNDMMYCWWQDPEKTKKYEAAVEDSSMTLETEAIEHHFWEAWQAAQ
ncbi:MAG: microcin C transport system substrate-binding protein [Planctomycetota bacterium]|jgi:microcin C transport system substrate-binding protein